MDKNGCPYFVPTFHGLTPERMVNIREKRPGLWEVRVFTDRDAAGKPVQESKTVRGTTKDAKRLAAQLTLRPASNATRRTVAELIGDYVKHKTPTWSIQTAGNHRGRVKLILADPIAKLAVARVSVRDVDGCILCMRQAGVGPTPRTATSPDRVRHRVGQPTPTESRIAP
jgi:translation initiation factor 1 (eIF-1/SUI1)